jgi:hypothetical protein
MWFTRRRTAKGRGDQKLVACAIRKELDGGVCYIESLGGNVAFPQAGDAFISQDALKRRHDARVRWARQAMARQWVGEGVDLKLQTNLTSQSAD